MSVKLRIEHVTKRFGSSVALNDVTFSINANDGGAPISLDGGKNARRTAADNRNSAQPLPHKLLAEAYPAADARPVTTRLIVGPKSSAGRNVKATPRVQGMGPRASDVVFFSTEKMRVLFVKSNYVRVEKYCEIRLRIIVKITSSIGFISSA